MGFCYKSNLLLLFLILKIINCNGDSDDTHRNQLAEDNLEVQQQQGDENLNMQQQEFIQDPPIQQENIEDDSQQGQIQDDLQPIEVEEQEELKDSDSQNEYIENNEQIQDNGQIQSEPVQDNDQEHAIVQDPGQAQDNNAEDNNVQFEQEQVQDHSQGNELNGQENEQVPENPQVVAPEHANIEDPNLDVLDIQKMEYVDFKDEDIKPFIIEHKPIKINIDRHLHQEPIIINQHRPKTIHLRDSGLEDFVNENRNHDKNVFKNEKFVRNREHINAHIDDSTFDTSEATDEELDFYFFNIHDLDNNKALDGLELLEAIMHGLEEQLEDVEDDDELTEEERKVEYDLLYSSAYYAVDRILLEDDVDENGYISIGEYVNSRRAIAEFREAHEQDDEDE